MVLWYGGVTELVLGGPRWAWAGRRREPSGVVWVVILPRKDAGKCRGGWGDFEPRKDTENTETGSGLGGF